PAPLRRSTAAVHRDCPPPRGHPASRGAASRRTEVSVEDCLFCKIVDGRIPGAIVYQDDQVVAFRDINPQAPTHLLVVPRKHIASLNTLSPEDDALVGAVVRAGAALAREHGHGDRGYRTVFNTN